LHFYQSIQKYISGFEEQLPELPNGIEALLPYSKSEATKLSDIFYQKYYSDTLTRSLLLGINPGRNGAGLTGIPFTDSKRLEEKCSISTTLKSYEPSSEFIYHMIDAFGGVDAFYRKFFISSTSPVGFIKEGKNYNYYDENILSTALTPYIIFQMSRLLELNLKRRKIICLGEGKNYKFLLNLNNRNHWFEEILPLPHPRFIMQYKRNQLSQYIDLYINTLNSII
jgi:hypothetical protein